HLCGVHIQWRVDWSRVAGRAIAIAAIAQVHWSRPLAPGASIGFDAKPGDSVEAALRGVRGVPLRAIRQRQGRASTYPAAMHLGRLAPRGADYHLTNASAIASRRRKGL